MFVLLSTRGVDDPHNGYGPNRFRRLAAAGKDLRSSARERNERDRIAVADIAELVLCIVLHRSTGVVNAVSGEVVSFRTLAEFIVAQFASPVTINGSPRSGPMPHNGLRPLPRALRSLRFRVSLLRRGAKADCRDVR